MNMKFRNDTNEDEVSPQGSVAMFNKPIVINSVDVYLDEPIAELGYYRNLLHYIRTMEEGDELRIWVDTPGGYLDTTLAMIDAINNSEGNITVIVSGKAHSAGGLLALAAPSLMIGDNASFMCHTASWGPGVAKHNNIVESVNYTTAQVNGIVKKYYKFFLTDQEIDMMLNGKDFWFDAEECKNRLENRVKLQDEALAEAKLKVEQATIEVKPKVKAKRKPKVSTEVIPK